MSFRFRKRVKVIPGVYLNFSSKGISTTIGPRGFSFNLSAKDFRPGIKSAANPKEIAERVEHLLQKTYDSTEEIKSQPIEQLTSLGLQSLRQTIIAAHTEHAEVSAKIADLSKNKNIRENKLSRLRKNLFAFLFKKRIERYNAEVQEMQDELAELTEQQSFAQVDLVIYNDDTFTSLYEKVRESYRSVISCEKSWDITSSKDIDRVRERSAASTEVNRSEIRAAIEDCRLILAKDMPFKLQNKNGGDLFFYPGFAIVHEQALDFAIVDYSQFAIEFRESRFIETDTVPTDSEIIGRTWAKVNKDGSPDKRFANNYQIPIAKYGELTFISPTGLREKYLFSNSNAASLFYSAMNEYLTAIKSASRVTAEQVL